MASSFVKNVCALVFRVYYMEDCSSLTMERDLHIQIRYPLSILRAFVSYDKKKNCIDKAR